MSRTAEIKVTVDLDGDNLPTRIEWQATEAQSDAPVPCQSVMLSLWDSENKTTAAIDLWTKDTSIDDMNLHFYQVFHKMADTYLRATKNADVAKLIHEFGDGFGKTLGLKMT
jgi:gliding motility-associated protein GldC